MPQFRLFLLERCLINPPPAPPAPPGPAMEAVSIGAVLGLVAPKLIELAIGGVAAALKKAGADDTEQMTADQFADIYMADDKQALRVNPKLGCVLGVWFEEARRNPPQDDEVATKLKTAGLVPEKSAVCGVFEASVRPTSDQTAFFLDTRHFSVREFIGDRRRDDRAYVVTLSLSTPASTIEGSTFALGRIDMGTLRINSSAIAPGQPEDAYPRYRSNLMPWMKISEASKKAYDADVAAGQAARRSYMPVTFTLTVSETADGIKFLARLGEFLEGAKEKAATEISKRIVPAEIEAAREEDLAAAEKLYDAELEAELEVRKAQKTLDVGADADKPALRVSLEIAKRKLAARTRIREAAGLPSRPPVP